MTTVSTTPEKGVMKSKINLVSMATLAITVATTFGLDITAESQVKILGLVGTIQPIVIYILRTWFTGSRISGFLK